MLKKSSRYSLNFSSNSLSEMMPSLFKSVVSGMNFFHSWLSTINSITACSIVGACGLVQFCSSLSSSQSLSPSQTKAEGIHPPLKAHRNECSPHLPPVELESSLQ